MKNLNNSLFKKFEPNRITNLEKIVGGVEGYTKYNGSGTGCDFFTQNKCADSEFKDYVIGGVTYTGDMYHNVPCPAK